MGNGRSPSRGGVYAGIAAMAITVGLGLVGAAGADEAATPTSTCATTAGTDCTPTPPHVHARETADVTINTGDTVTCHFVRQHRTHNAVGRPGRWKVPDAPRSRAERHATYTKTFTQPGDIHVRLRAAHSEMTGTVTVEGAAATQPRRAPTPTPTPSTAAGRRDHARRRRPPATPSSRPCAAVSPTAAAPRRARAVQAVGAGDRDGARQAPRVAQGAQVRARPGGRGHAQRDAPEQAPEEGPLHRRDPRRATRTGTSRGSPRSS